MAAIVAPEDVRPDPDQPFDGYWDLPWVGFTVGALVFATDLRAIARKAVAGEGPDSRTPEEVMETMLAEFVALGEHFQLPQGEFSQGVANLEKILRYHLESDYDNEWVALLAGCEDLIQQLSETIRDAVVDFEIFRNQLERKGSTDPEILRTMEGLAGSADRMRLLLLVADKAGEVGEA